MFSGNNQSHKFISSLDLNFLDIKFKSLKKDSIEISQSSKLGRNITLPLLNNKKNRIDTSFDGTSIISTPIHAHSIIPENVDLYDYIQSIEKVKKSQCTTVKKENQQKKVQNSNRYKKMIKGMKKQNELLHKHITKLYYENNAKANFQSSNPISDNNTHIQMGTKGIKHVKNLRLLTNTDQNAQNLTQNSQNFPNREPSNTLNSCSTNGKKYDSKQISYNKYEKLYENLYDENKGESRKFELENLKKKIMNNNLDKNLETYFSDKKMRIPQFIKRLR